MELLYLESTALADSDVAAETADVRYGPWGKCKVNPDHRPGRRRLSPLVVKLERAPSDLMMTNGSNWIATDRLRALFAEHSIAGAEFRTARAIAPSGRKGSKRTVVAPVWELFVVGWGGFASEASGVRPLTERACPGCGYMKYSKVTDPSHFFDESQWDGSDIFRIWPYPMRFFVSRRLAELLRLYRVSGVAARGLADFAAECADPAMQFGFTPGPPDDYFPPDRARQIERTLGIG